MLGAMHHPRDFGPFNFEDLLQSIHWG